MPANNITKTKPNNIQPSIQYQSKEYFRRLLNYVATAFFAVTVLVLPMFMSREKYTAITAAKAGFFSTTCTIALIAVVILLSAMFIYCVDITDSKKKNRLPLRARISDDPLLIADISIVAYWVLMFFSCILSDDVRTALYGMQPRNNGFFYQTLYVAAYFVISRAMKPSRSKALLFVWGGAVLGVATILHYFGHDLYDVVHYSSQSSSGEWVDKTLSSSYAGPFWNSSSYRFLGPVGNVNLGSYILSVALVLAAGFYITGVQPRFYKWQSGDTAVKNGRQLRKQQNSFLSSFVGVPDKLGISLVVCFAVILYAELNINTDAGLVALAAAVVAIPIVLCGTLERLSRAMIIFTVSAGVALLDRVVDCSLCDKSIGTTGKALILVTVLLAAVSFAVMVLKKKETVQRVVTTRRLRITLSCLVLLAVIGGISLALVITQPDQPAAGALSGAGVVLESHDVSEKSDTIIHELGQILRGNLDDSFGHNRLFTWKRTLSLIKHHPLLGIGPDNFKTFFARYYRAEAVEMFPSSNGNLDKAHNEFLDVLISNGIIGFAVYMAFFAALLWCCFRNADRTKYAPVFGVAVVSYMAHAFFGYQLPIQSPVMWIMIGMAAACARSASARSVKPAAGRQKA